MQYFLAHESLTSLTDYTSPRAVGFARTDNDFISSLAANADQTPC